mgnify:CR=1 FL=1
MDIEAAATNVIQLGSQFHSISKIRREAEGQERKSFKALFEGWFCLQEIYHTINQLLRKFMVFKENIDADYKPLDGRDLSVERTFLIEGRSKVDLKEVRQKEWRCTPIIVKKGDSYLRG